MVSEEEQDKARTERETFETRCFRFTRGHSFDQPYSVTTTRMYEDCVLQSMRFPQKLWRIVNECETGAIRWGANGDTILLDYKRFQTEYLDTRRPIFKTSNITSFIRQLNLYGFRKVTYHGRDPACNSCNPHVHEFLHDNFRADRIDMLSKVCRKTGRKTRCSQHETAKNEEESPRSETNHVSRLKLCQVHLSNASYDIFIHNIIHTHMCGTIIIIIRKLALTETLEQITQEYRREHNQGKKLIITKDNTPKQIRNTQEDTVPVLYEIEFNNVSNQKPTIERNIKYSAYQFLPTKINTSFERKIITPPQCIALIDKRDLHFNIQNIH
ncbi:Heat shock transcription factor, Y-linked [Trachymyrmex cornetzi]|uniref:Heat shock transcription factor, Y-linked n=1 Tax=Trachymyrmex cornetzi TaxID=471704 RepID=A0A151IV09_9HYME|nr:Heat shock transcription factor, Y-linked [Trachymyrmex cornetzi]